MAKHKQMGRFKTRDHSYQTYDRQTIDSTGAFLVGQLERLDQTLNEPLVECTWSRDIELRDDVTMGDEVSSFTNSTFASAANSGGKGIQWIGKNTNAIPGVALDMSKTTNDLGIWAREIGWTMPELMSAQQIGRQIDNDKFAAMNLDYQMDLDQLVYIGDVNAQKEGLLNCSKVSLTNAPNGASSNSNWKAKTADEIVDDIDNLLLQAWTTSAYAVCPDKILLPPDQFALIVRRKVSDAGNISVLNYIKDNCICLAKNGRPVDIQPVKWATGIGAGGRDRMMAYTNDRKRVRIPLVPLQRTPLEYRSLYQLTTYFGRMGGVEFVYPETLAYMDGI